jgi:capsular polysaccharide biosynthesis protein
VSFRGLVVRVLLVLVIAALVGVAALELSRRQPTSYQATGSLVFSSQLSPELQVLGAPFTGPNTDPKTQASTNAQLVKSFDVARIVARRHPELGLDAAAVAGHVSVGEVAGTQLVSVTATGETQRRALDLATVYQDEYVTVTRARQARRAQLVEAELRGRYAALPASAKAATQGATLRAQIATLDMLQRVGSGQVDIAQQPRASADPSQPKTRRNVGFGVLFGLVLGIGLVALRSELRRART